MVALGAVRGRSVLSCATSAETCGLVSTMLCAASIFAAGSLVAKRAARALGHDLNMRGHLYPTLSAATLGAAVLAERMHSQNWNLDRLVGLIIGGVCAFTDLQVGYVYDKVLMLGSCLILVIAATLGEMEHALLGALAALALPLTAYVSTRGRALGFGDVKLAAFLGAATGLRGVVPMLIVACISAGVIGCSLVAAGWKRWNDSLPFAPFLVLGAWAIVFGARLWQ